MHQKKATIREEKEGEEQKKWTQFRFYPLIEVQLYMSLMEFTHFFVSMFCKNYKKTFKRVI